MRAHFNQDEFKCKCGCGMDIDDNLKSLIFEARELANVPFVITSGARCLAHNSDIGGKPSSAHTRGLAVDIAFNSSSRAFAILSAFVKLGAVRIGYNQKKMFFHIDIDDSLPQNVFFNY